MEDDKRHNYLQTKVEGGENTTQSMNAEKMIRENQHAIMKQMTMKKKAFVCQIQG